METRFRTLIEHWPNHAALTDTLRPILVLSRVGLSAVDEHHLRDEFVRECGENVLSVILSLKMMHVYFRLGSKTVDYRPHRGPFSGIVEADYRLPKSDRLEALIVLSEEERKRLDQYVAEISRSPAEVLGKPHALQLGDPDFTVREHATAGTLRRNSFLNPSLRHNCLTWFTTAPLATDGVPFLESLGMKESDLAAEAHSYIVAFHRFLMSEVSGDRVPSVVLWTNSPVVQALERARCDPNFSNDFYGKPN